jgi:hypothetical protein
MQHIKPIAALSAAEIHDLARAAADRGEDHDDANPFAAQADPASYRAYARAFHDRADELTAVA